jgi:hypothetical protein
MLLDDAHRVAAGRRRPRNGDAGEQPVWHRPKTDDLLGPARVRPVGIADVAGT